MSMLLERIQMLKHVLMIMFSSVLTAGEIKIVNDSPEPIRGVWFQTPTNMGPNYVAVPPSPIVFESQSIGGQFYSGPTATTHFAAKFSPSRTGELTHISAFVNKLSGTGEFVIEVRANNASKPGALLSIGTDFAPTYMAYKKVAMSGTILVYGTEYFCVIYATAGNSIRWGYTGANGNWGWSTNSGSTWATRTDRNFQFKVYEVVPTALLYPGESLTISCASGFYQVYIAGNGTTTYTASYAQWGSDLGVYDFGFEIDRNFTYIFHYKDQNDSWFEKKLESAYNPSGCSTSDDVAYMPLLIIFIILATSTIAKRRA